MFKTLRVSNINSNYYDNIDERYTTSNDLTVAARPGAYARACREGPTAVVLDEGHHTADHQAWGRAIRARSTRSSATATAAAAGC